MKRKLFLLPITLTALAPAISLVGCGGDTPEPPEPTKLEFSVSDCSMSSYIEATISLDWQPTGDKITFTNFLFIYDGTKQVTDITPQGLTYDRPNVLKIVFSEEIDHDINGILTFNYNDETSKISSAGSVSDIVIPKYVPPPTPRPDFNTCGWSTIIEACDLLEQTGNTERFYNTFQLDDLSTPDPHDKKNATSMQDFIGQERKVEVNSNDHKVIVLDTQEDTLYSEPNETSNDTKAALTFQFKNVICDESGRALKTYWYEPISYSEPRNYWGSELFNFLNGEPHYHEYNVYQMISNGNNDGLANGIKTVSQLVGIDPYLNWYTEPRSTKLFEPTLSNLFSVSGIKNTNIPEIRGKVDTLTWYCEEGQPHSGDEGAQYAYYAQSDTLNSNGEYLYINQHTLSLDDSFACLECCDLKGSPCKYWITTPFMCSVSKSIVWSVDENSKMSISLLGATNIPVAPCFCI